MTPETTESSEHLPSPLIVGPDARKGKILLPGEVEDIRKKITLPGDSKILLSPMARREAEQRKQREDAEQHGDDLQYAVKFNHAQRRWHLRYAAKMRRRQARAEARKQRRLEQTIFSFATQHYDASLRRTVRFNSLGEPIKVIQRPADRQIRIEGGYLNEIEYRDGKLVALGEPLRKSKAQMELEANVKLGIYPKVKISKLSRSYIGSLRTRKPRTAKEAAAENAALAAA
jgi:hypothetical protein